MFEYYDLLITPEDAAEMLGCGMNSIYKILKRLRLFVLLKLLQIAPVLSTLSEEIAEMACRGVKSGVN